MIKCAIKSKWRDVRVEFSRMKPEVAAMTRIVPSQVIETIDRLFTGPSKGVGTAALNVECIYHLQGIVRLVREVPNELLTVNAADFADLTIAIAAIELLMLRWSSGEGRYVIPPVSGEDVIHTIRRVLSKCPDESSPAGTADLLFITDQQIRDSMIQDIGAANSALQNAEWKAASILGGAAIEALLHWKLSEPQTAATIVTTAMKKAVSSGKFRKSTSTDINDWRLVEFITIVRDLDIIEEETHKQADTARDYRNFIHPGFAARRNQICDRATALAVLSGLEHVIRDISR
jgi:hypothetical protein